MSSITLDPITKLKKDVREAAATLSEREARYLVDAYYTIQGHRIEAQSQVRALNEAEEPNDVLGWLFDQHAAIEGEIRKTLDTYSSSKTPGVWAKSITGIGPVIAAGLLAHIDVQKANTAGKVWRFAGLDPTVRWGKGEKRPWNADLKVLCWKAGESFVKVSGRAWLKETAVDDESTNGSERAAEAKSTDADEAGSEIMQRTLLPAPPKPEDLYAWLFAKRKIQEITKNEAGDFADQAAASLAEKNYGKATEARKWYEQGKLPPARIHARAQRYAVKLFLAHFHHVAFESAFGEPPPKPYVITHLGHTDYLAPPNWPLGT